LSDELDAIKATWADINFNVQLVPLDEKTDALKLVDLDDIFNALDESLA